MGLSVSGKVRRALARDQIARAVWLTFWRLTRVKRREENHRILYGNPAAAQPLGVLNAKAIPR